MLISLYLTCSRDKPLDLELLPGFEEENPLPMHKNTV